MTGSRRRHSPARAGNRLGDALARWRPSVRRERRYRRDAQVAVYEAINLRV